LLVQVKYTAQECRPGVYAVKAARQKIRESAGSEDR